jgi:hypothetical protein
MRVGAWLFVAVVVGAACQPGQVLSRTQLPTASAGLLGIQVDLPRGTYCWSSGGQGECADVASFDDVFRLRHLKPYQMTGGSSVEVVFHSTSELLGSSVELGQAPGLKKEDIGKTMALPIQIPTSPPATTGLYVYVITGQWHEGNVTFLLPIELIPGTE